MYPPKGPNDPLSAELAGYVAAYQRSGDLGHLLDHLKAFAERSEAKTGVYSYENRHLAEFSAEESAAFRANEAAWAWFQSRPPSYRTQATWWVVSAKRDETRQKRFAELVAESAAGRMPKHLTPPGRNQDGSSAR